MKSISNVEFLIIVFVFLFLFINPSNTSAAMFGEKGTPEWENPEVIGINKGLPHASFIPYHDAEAAALFKEEKSDRYKLLNGVWKLIICIDRIFLP